MGSGLEVEGIVCPRPRVQRTLTMSAGGRYVVYVGCATSIPEVNTSGANDPVILLN